MLLQHGPTKAPGLKLYLNKLRKDAKKHLDKAGPNYLPLDLNCLTPKMFLDYLLSLFNTLHRLQFVIQRQPCPWETVSAAIVKSREESRSVSGNL